MPHRFRYSVFALLIDLDRLAEAGRLSRFFSVGRANLIGFATAGHGPAGACDDPGAAVRRMLAGAGLDAPVKRVFLLCYPRVFGFVFNPISIYFAYDAAGTLVGVVYEVRNTFGDKHCYVAPVSPGELTEAGLRQRTPKRFYVSPFLPPDMGYHFRLRPPDDRGVALRILAADGDGPMLSAAFSGRAEPVSDRSCLRLAAGIPLMTLKVVAGIHVEALRLWFKGIAFFHRPAPPPAASHAGHFLPREDARAGGRTP